MTFSILTFDRETGVFAGAAATGSLCVGGWVLRGDIESGLVASQGTAPSTFWRDDVLRAMYAGTPARAAVEAATHHDTGQGHRQLAALDRNGGSFAFTGAESLPYAGHQCETDMALAGNMLADAGVLTAMAQAASKTGLRPCERMLLALEAGAAAGGDVRGLQSAALLVLMPDQPPLDLRIDYEEDPIAALRALCARAGQTPYSGWLDVVPVLRDKSRAP